MREADLLARRRESRRSWLDLGEGRRLRLEAMSPGDYRRFWGAAPTDPIDALIAKVVIGWEGFVEADIDPNGSDQPMPFTVALLQAWCDDRQDMLLTVYEACSAACNASAAKLAQITEKLAP